MKLAGAALVALRGQGKAVTAWLGTARKGKAVTVWAWPGGLGLFGFGGARRVRAVNNRKETKWH